MLLTTHATEQRLLISTLHTVETDALLLEPCMLTSANCALDQESQETAESVVLGKTGAGTRATGMAIGAAAVDPPRGSTSAVLKVLLSVRLRSNGGHASYPGWLVLPECCRC